MVMDGCAKFVMRENVVCGVKKIPKDSPLISGVIVTARMDGKKNASGLARQRRKLMISGGEALRNIKHGDAPMREARKW